MLCVAGRRGLHSDTLRFACIAFETICKRHARTVHRSPGVDRTTPVLAHVHLNMDRLLPVIAVLVLAIAGEFVHAGTSTLSPLPLVPLLRAAAASKQQGGNALA